MMPNHSTIRTFVYLLLILAGLNACSWIDRIRPAETPTQTVQPTITATPQPKPLGSPENPVVQGIVLPMENDESVEAGNTLAGRLSSASGYTLQTRYFEDYPALLDEMDMGRVHLAWLPPLTYIYAGEQGFAQVVLLTNHFGVYFYGTQFLANADSGFTSYFDPDLNNILADAEMALQQFSGRIPCFVDLSSPSGYLLPAGLLAENSIELQPAVITQSHTAVIRALYVKGICDFGVTFAVSGDPRTSTSLQDLPDIIHRIPILWKTGAVIPNLSLSILPEIPQEMRDQLVKSYLEVTNNKDGSQLLTAALDYDVQELKAVDDDAYSALREAIIALSLETGILIGK